jgi:Tfp pilus assembly PilM family ATPase
VTFRGQRPASVTFVGGEAHEPTLAAVIGDGLEVPCTIGNPLRGIQNAGAACGPDRRTLQPAWAVATGLALRSSPWVQPRWSAALNTNRSSAPLPV